MYNRSSLKNHQTLVEKGYLHLFCNLSLFSNFCAIYNFFLSTSFGCEKQCFPCRFYMGGGILEGAIHIGGMGTIGLGGLPYVLQVYFWTPDLSRIGSYKITHVSPSVR